MEGERQLDPSVTELPQLARPLMGHRGSTRIAREKEGAREGEPAPTRMKNRIDFRTLLSLRRYRRL